MVPQPAGATDGTHHRSGQIHDSFIFNFVAANTVKGRVLQKLLEKLQEVRDSLDDDAVFNVVGEILPAAQIERILRAHYAGEMGQEDMEDRLLRDEQEERFRAICQNALEGLAAKKLNLDMLAQGACSCQEVRQERVAEGDRIAAHVVLSLMELLERREPVEPQKGHSPYPAERDILLRQENRSAFLRPGPQYLRRKLQGGW